MGHIYLPLTIQINEYLNLSPFIFAYLDPGSGSFIIQLIMAGFAGLLYAFRGYWAKLIGLLRKSPTDSKPDKIDTNDTDQ